MASALTSGLRPGGPQDHPGGQPAQEGANHPCIRDVVRGDGGRDGSAAEPSKRR